MKITHPHFQTRRVNIILENNICAKNPKWVDIDIMYDAHRT